MSQMVVRCPVCDSPHVNEDKLINRYTCLSCGHKFIEEDVK